MKKSMEKPFVKVVKMEAVDICTASGDKISDNTATVIVNDYSDTKKSMW